MSNVVSSRQKRDRDGEGASTGIVPGAGSIASLMQQQSGAPSGGHIYQAIPTSAITSSAPVVAGGDEASGGGEQGDGAPPAPRKAGGANMFSNKTKTQKKKEFYKRKGEKETMRIKTQIASGHKLNLAPKDGTSSTKDKPATDGEVEDAAPKENAVAEASTCIFDRAHGWHCVWQQLWKDCNRGAGGGAGADDEDDEAAEDVLEDSYIFNQGQIAKACLKCENYSVQKFMTWNNRFFHKSNRYNRVFDIVNAALEFHTTDGSWSWVEMEWVKILEKLYRAFQDEETGEMLEAVSIKNLRAKTGMDLQDEHFVTGCLATVGRKQDNIPTHHNICLGVEPEDRSIRSLKAFLKAHGNEDQRLPRCTQQWVSRPAMSAPTPNPAGKKLKKGVQAKDIKEDDNKEATAPIVAAGGGKHRSLKRIVTKIFNELQVTPGRQLYWNPVVAPPAKGEKKVPVDNSKPQEASFLKQLGVSKEDFGVSPNVGALDPWFRLTGQVLVLVEQPSSGKMQFRQQEALLACVNATTATSSSAKKKEQTSVPYGNDGNMFSSGEEEWGAGPSNASYAFKGRKKTTQSLQERARDAKSHASKTEHKKASGHKSVKKLVWAPKKKSGAPGGEGGAANPKVVKLDV